MESKYEEMDRYTEGIELSNKCREFYQRRMETAENVKQRLSPLPKKERKKSTLDDAMEKLRSEMTSLMDQDLSLMKQLLTLNEAVEDLKWRSRNNSRSFSTSSCDLSGSDMSVSDTEMMYHSEDDDSLKVDKKLESGSECKEQSESTTIKDDVLDNESWITDTTSLLEEVSEKLKMDFHGSCDSGIHTG